MVQEVRQRSERCAYCGQERQLTHDHIPPRNLFPKPRPSDMLTVPCCEPCRRGWSKDDEYLRVVVLTAENLPGDEGVEKGRRTVARSLAKPRKEAFAAKVMGSFVDVDVKTAGGLYLPSKLGFQFDKSRVSRVLQRIVRGIFYHEFGQPVPADCRVDADLDQYGKDIRSILERAPRFPWSRIGEFCGGRFWYKCKCDESSGPEAGTIWIGALYDRVFFRGRTKPMGSSLSQTAQTSVDRTRS